MRLSENWSKPSYTEGRNRLAALLNLEELEPRNLLSTASQSVGAVIINSAEHFQDFIAGDYVTFLHRLPSQLEVNNLVAVMETGVAPEVIEAAFVSSNEYILDHGANAALWLTGLYQNMLG